MTLAQTLAYWGTAAVAIVALVRYIALPIRSLVKSFAELRRELEALCDVQIWTLRRSRTTGYEEQVERLELAFGRAPGRERRRA